MEFFNEETIAYNGDQIFWESISRNFSKSTLVAFALKNFYIFRCKTISRELPLRNHRRIHRTAVSISNSCQEYSKGKEKKVRVRLPSHTITAKPRNCVARRRVLVVVWHFPISITFHHVFERVWICLNAFEYVWTCLNMYERVWTGLDVFGHVWAYHCLLYASAIRVELCNFTETRLRRDKEDCKDMLNESIWRNAKWKNRKKEENRISKKRNARTIETALFETTQQSWCWTRRRLTTAKA